MGLGRIGEGGHPFLHRESDLGLAHRLQFRVGLGVARHEQRAAVRRVHGRDLEGAQLLGRLDDLQLVRANERPQHWQFHRVVRGADVVQGLRGHLP